MIKFRYDIFKHYSYIVTGQQMNLLKVSMLILGLMKISIKVKVIKAPQGYNPVGIGLRMAKAPQSG